MALTRKRFEASKKCLHYNDNAQCHPQDDPIFDQFFRVQPVIDHFSNKFAEMYISQRDICVDKSLIHFKGKLKFRQYLPSKRARYEIKLYKLFKSTLRYTHRLTVYEGKDTRNEPPECPPCPGIDDMHRQLLKDSFMVELVEGARKLRHVFLFTDLLLCAKLKKQLGGKSQQYDCKWYIPLADLSFQPLDESETAINIPLIQDDELETIKVKISQLKSDIQRERKANKGGKGQERLRKKLSEQESMLLLLSPSMAFRVHNRNGKGYTFLTWSDYERAEWGEHIREQQKKCVKSFSLTSLEIQMLTNSCVKLQTVHRVPLTIGKEDDESSGLYGFLNVIVHSASGFQQSSSMCHCHQYDHHTVEYSFHIVYKSESFMTLASLLVPIDLFCSLEVDSFGYFVNKAKTRVYRNTTEPSWNEEFEIELEGSQTLRILCYEKFYNKNRPVREDVGESSERLVAKGQVQLDPQLVIGKDWQRSVVSMNGIEVKLSMKFISREFSLKRLPSRKQTGVFGVKIGVVTKRERSKVPYIVRQCVEEIERRGMEEVGIYRVSGVATDIQALKNAFDSNNKDVAIMMSDMDVNAIAGTLKLYFRELPAPLFTDELYPNFAEGIALSDPVAKESCMLNLLLSLPEPNLLTFLYLLDHLKRVADKESQNKMSLHNIATVFGPTLLRPSEKDSKIPTNPTQPISMADSWSLEVMSQVQVLLYFSTTGHNSHPGQQASEHTFLH
ncbi:unnamed protein product [Ranitomeya imitator]|uniref:Breakpoint cluster region protein n=1 Tax=Ranitomeya imitator TaxID=111125 RepID=A0ABN9M665_9NEOB|nr:unnamed protein product [Ranitomeya imitator]